MAKRLATEYVKASLQLTDAEMKNFLQLFTAQEITAHVKVCENGTQEIVFEDGPGEEIVLSFERKLGKYVSNGSCKFTNQRLANAFRQAVSKFKGDAIVNRIYPTYRVMYEYNQGSVVKIKEFSEHHEKLIYEYKNTIGEIESLYRKQQVEDEICALQLEINALLDQRNQAQDPLLIKDIDNYLRQCTHQMFVLEA
jgi:hypothetical protein